MGVIAPRFVADGVRVVRVLIVLIALVVLSGCSQTGLLEKLSSPEQQAAARHYVELLRDHKFEEIESSTDPSLKTPSLRGTLEKMASLVPAVDPSSIKLVGAQSVHGPAGSTVNTTFEYEFPDQWLLVSVAIKTQNGASTLVGFNVAPQSAALEEQNRFQLGGKRPAQYSILAFAIAAVAATLYALVLCIRTRLRGRKWPWILFILIGFGKLSVNWSTAQVDLLPFFAQLFSVSAFAPLYGPWTLAVSLPVGAVVFLVKRRQLMAPGVAP